jgi:hypothetical protein
MTQKMHIAQARAAGFTVDSHCYPPIAYKGPRFNPTEYRDCYTELESALMSMLPFVQAVARDSDSVHSVAARDLLDNELQAIAQLPGTPQLAPQ